MTISPAQATPIGKLLPKRAVAETLSVCTKTVMDRVKNDPAFLRAIKMNKRVYFLEPEVENYKRHIVSNYMSGRAQDAAR